MGVFWLFYMNILHIFVRGAKKDKIFFIFFKKGVAFSKLLWYTTRAFEQRPVGQAAKTLASHAGNMGSIPVRVTTDRKQDTCPAFLFCRWRPVRSSNLAPAQLWVSLLQPNRRAFGNSAGAWVRICAVEQRSLARRWQGARY